MTRTHLSTPFVSTPLVSLVPFVSLISVLALGLSAVGCASDANGDAADAPASQAEAFTSPNWQPLLRCDDGAAVLDVDVNERRNLQLVIRDPGILSYFSQFEFFHFGQREHVIQSGYEAKYGLAFDDPTGPKLRTIDAVGVFAPSDFHFFLGNASVSSPNSTLAGRFYSVYRDGPGLTVELESLELRGCAGTIRPRVCGGESPGGGGCGFFCDGPDYTALATTASWHFQSCQ